MNHFPSASQLVKDVQLFKSPSFWVTKPVTLPQDIHPLPEDITAYFVYPHTLEVHALSTLPTSINSLQSTQQQRKQFLLQRQEAVEARKKAELNKLAPGWIGEGAVMMPSSAAKKSTMQSAVPGTTSEVKVEEVRKEVEVIPEDALSSLAGLHLE